MTYIALLGNAPRPLGLQINKIYKLINSEIEVISGVSRLGKKKQKPRKERVVT
jgi:hypothetical protein